MGQVINTNVMSLNAQRNLNSSGAGLATALQRLSSGMRINSAKDDAAGLAISNRMTAQIRGLNQAGRNANDGISLAQTAEGAMGTITGSLQRIRELSIQSANATNSASDRTALQAEASQLIAEIDRVASTTAFNSVNLLDGTFTSQQFQVGADANQTITLSSIASARTGDLGSSFSATITGSNLVSGTAIVAGDLIINGVDTGAMATPDAKAFAAQINGLSITGVTASATASAVTGIAATGFANAITAGDVTVNGISVGAVAIDANATDRASGLITAINTVSATTGVVATNATATTITLTAADGRNITIGQSGTGTTANTGLTAAVTEGAVKLDSVGSQGIVRTTTGTIGNAGFSAGTTAAAAGGTAVSLLDISTVGGANTAIASIDAALNTINSSRATLGAIQSRFESVVSNLAVTAENLSTARSRIQDADFAAETAALTKGQILQQAGISILSQANSQPQLVLSLLQ
jgi:flagellin